MITPQQLAKCNTEHGHQCALFAWAALSKISELKLMFAIPNGGKRTLVAGAKLKAEGVKPGVPDIFLAIPKGNHHGLFIELKKPKVGIVTNEQHEWLALLSDQYYATRVCFGWEEARDCLLEYLGNKSFS